jgi:hypothetical protein
MTSSEKYELCLRLYNDVIQGYSEHKHGDEKIYVKHLRDVDYAVFEHRKELFKIEGINRGLKTEEEHLEILDKTGHWSTEEEEKYQRLLTEINNLRKTNDNVFLESQRKRIQERIKEREQELIDVGKNRNLIPVTTAETFAQEKLSSFIIRFCLYKTPELDEKIYDQERFNNLDLEDIKILNDIYSESSLLFTQKNINRIACLGVFINSFMLAQGNPFYFFNKRICDLTSYQTMLSSFGNGCKNILEHSENDMPKYEDVDEMVAWYEREREIIKRKFSGKKSAGPPPSAGGEKKQRLEGMSVPQASKEEIEIVGMAKEAQPVNLIEAAEKLKKKLGKDTLDTKDMIQLHM